MLEEWWMDFWGHHRIHIYILFTKEPRRVHQYHRETHSGIKKVMKSSSFKYPLFCWSASLSICLIVSSDSFSFKEVTVSRKVSLVIRPDRFLSKSWKANESSVLAFFSTVRIPKWILNEDRDMPLGSKGATAASQSWMLGEKPRAFRTADNSSAVSPSETKGINYVSHILVLSKIEG